MSGHSRGGLSEIAPGVREGIREGGRVARVPGRPGVGERLCVPGLGVPGRGAAPAGGGIVRNSDRRPR
jgi:hypothetical protein